jgi:hypothetical protein
MTQPRRMMALALTGITLLLVSVSVAAEWTVIHAGTLLAVPGEPAHNEMTVLIRDDRVATGYRTAADLGIAAADSRVINLRDRFAGWPD